MQQVNLQVLLFLEECVLQELAPNSAQHTLPVSALPDPQGLARLARTLHELGVLLLRAGGVRAGRAAELGGLEQAHAAALQPALARVCVAVPAQWGCLGPGCSCVKRQLTVKWIIALHMPW